MPVEMLKPRPQGGPIADEERKRQLEAILDTYRSAQQSGNRQDVIALAKQIRQIRNELDSRPRVTLSRRSSKAGLFDR